MKLLDFCCVLAIIVVCVTAIIDTGYYEMFIAVVLCTAFARTSAKQRIEWSLSSGWRNVPEDEWDQNAPWGATHVAELYMVLDDQPGYLL